MSEMVNIILNHQHLKANMNMVPKLFMVCLEFKADICRVAELYLYGGYYFDIDIGVVKPLDVDALPIPTEILEPTWNLHSIKKNRLEQAEKDDIATFVTVVNKQGRFFQAFTASMPRHPVLKRSLGKWG